MDSKKQNHDSFTVERLQPSDVRAMADLHSDVFIDTFTNPPYNLDTDYASKRMTDKYTDEAVARIQKLTTENSSTTHRIWFVAKDNQGRIIGMARPYRKDDEDHQRVGAMYVDKYYRGSGVSDALMEKVIDWSRPGQALYLWVAKYNQRAIGFYKRWGFCFVDGKENIAYGKIPHVQMVREEASNEI